MKLGDINSTTEVGLIGAWTAYTPTFTGDTGASTIGNGTIVGRWMQVGEKVVVAKFALSIGATTSFNAGWVRVGLPLAHIVVAGFGTMTVGVVTVVSKGVQYTGTAWVPNATPATVAFNIPASNAVFATRPAANTDFQSGDYVMGTVTFEAT